MAVAPSAVRHFFPFSCFNPAPACSLSSKTQCKPSLPNSLAISTDSRSFSRRPRVVEKPLFGRIFAYLNGNEDAREGGADVKSKSKSKSKNKKGVRKKCVKSNETLVERIEQETRARRKEDRDSTPVVRAITWALRGVTDEAGVNEIIGGLEFYIQIFTSVIQKLGGEGKPQAAVAVFRWLQRREQGSDITSRPNVYTYNSLLGALKANRCYELADTIVADMRENGVALDIVTCNTLISMYEEQGLDNEVLKVYDGLNPSGMVADLFTFRNVIQILGRNGKTERMLDVYRDLRKQEKSGVESPRPEMKRAKLQREELDRSVLQVSYQSLWDWLRSDTSTVPEVGELLERMRDSEVKLTAKMCRDLIQACGKREIDHYLVKAVFVSMRQQEFPVTVSLCNHVIKVLGLGKKWWAALEVYEEMIDIGPPPDETTHRLLLSHFQILLNAARDRRMWKWALQLLEKMQEKGIKPDAFAWNAALIACGRANEPTSAIQVFQNMIAQGQKPGVLSYGALLSALEKGGLLEKAEQVWDHMKKVGTLPNEYAYTTMITVYGKAGNYGKAVDLLEEMQVSGMEPTVVTYNAIITACARAGDGQRALDWLQQMKVALVQPDSVTYSQVIEALANEGQWELAISHYLKMRELKLQPPCTAYDAVLRVCNANNVRADHGSIGVRPQELKHRKHFRRKTIKLLDVEADRGSTIPAAA